MTFLNQLFHSILAAMTSWRHAVHFTTYLKNSATGLRTCANVHARPVLAANREIIGYNVHVERYDLRTNALVDTFSTQFSVERFNKFRRDYA